MKDGLIADAKSNLIKSHPLGPNQSYTNMSIDIQTTESGGTNGQVASINKISMTATISQMSLSSAILPWIIPCQFGYWEN